MPEIEIVVPSHLHNKIKAMAELRRETNFIFLYTPERAPGGNMRWLVHSHHMLGMGNAVEVGADLKYREAGNLLVQKLRRSAPRAGYEFMKVHTHCRGTGEEWFHQFSSGDFDGVRAELPENPDFTLLMYSPTHHLATGHPNNHYSITVVPSTPQHRAMSQRLSRVYRRLAEEHGIRLLAMTDKE
ncbi:MAG: hypothetical protein V1722_04020 [Candidatus Micrarchaeota archaeon]